MKEQNLNIRYMVAQLSELSQQERELVSCCWATAE